MMPSAPATCSGPVSRTRRRPSGIIDSFQANVERNGPSTRSLRATDLKRARGGDRHAVVPRPVAIHQRVPLGRPLRVLSLLGNDMNRAGRGDR